MGVFLVLIISFWSNHHNNGSQRSFWNDDKIVSLQSYGSDDWKHGLKITQGIMLVVKLYLYAYEEFVIIPVMDTANARRDQSRRKSGVFDSGTCAGMYQKVESLPENTLSLKERSLFHQPTYKCILTLNNYKSAYSTHHCNPDACIHELIVSIARHTRSLMVDNPLPDTDTNWQSAFIQFS